MYATPTQHQNPLWLTPSPRTHQFLTERRELRRLYMAVGLALFLAAVTASTASAAGNRFLQALKPAAAPAGFAQTCKTYAWVCLGSSATQSAAQSALPLANKINREINRQYPEISDIAQYNREEVWSLPTARGGDCEDFALLKKQRLQRAGVPAASLLIATVLDRSRNSHAVLVMRTDQGDFVLDNLTNRIVRWNETGYIFLKMQSSRNPGQWDAILARG